MLSPSAANDVARLSVIEEDGDTAPRPRSPRASHRPFNRRWKDDPPRHSFEAPPPEYNVWDTEGPKGERLFDLRNHKHIARRGGWKRLLLIILVIIVALVALSVGLGLGLTRRSESNSPSSSSDAATSATPEPFPAGSYSLPVYLTAMPSNCTANPATWRCYPYTTFSLSSNQSRGVFNWIITSSGSPAGYQISSAENPFAIIFTNLSLTLLDTGLGNERYHFSFFYDQAIHPTSSITTDNSQALCYFNGTTFGADLYTRKNLDEDVRTSFDKDATNTWQTWPHAVEVMQTISGGQNVPNCYESVDGNLGARITSGLDPRPTQDQCECLWKNFDL